MGILTWDTCSLTGIWIIRLKWPALFRAAIASQKKKSKAQRILIYFLLLQIHSLFHYQHLPPEWHICYNEPEVTHHFQFEAQSLCKGSLLRLYILSVAMSYKILWVQKKKIPVLHILTPASPSLWRPQILSQLSQFALQINHFSL